MSEGTSPADEAIPATYWSFVEKFPALAEAHASIGKAVDEAGPLDAKARELIKIGMCLGAGLETATRSHVRRAHAAGATQEEMEQAILLGMNTCGFPATVAAWRWMRQALDLEE